MMDQPEASIHVLADSIEIGPFSEERGGLRTNATLVLSGTAGGIEYRRSEALTLLVSLHGDDIVVSAHDAILDFPSLVTVARCVAAELGTPAGRAALAEAASKTRHDSTPGLSVRVPLQ